MVRDWRGICRPLSQRWGKWDIETVADVLIATVEQPSRVRHYHHGSCWIVGNPWRTMSSASFWAESSLRQDAGLTGGGEPDVPCYLAVIDETIYSKSNSICQKL